MGESEWGRPHRIDTKYSNGIGTDRYEYRTRQTADDRMTGITRLVLPLPPSVDHTYRNFTKGGRRVRAPTAKAMAFKRQAAWEAKAWMLANGTKVALKVWYYWGERRRHDRKLAETASGCSNRRCMGR